MEVKAGQIWKHKKLASFIEVVGVAGSAVKFKFQDSQSGLVYVELETYIRSNFEFVRNKGDVSRKLEVNEPKEIIVKADGLKIAGVEVDEAWIKGMTGAALTQKSTPRSDAINHPEHYISHPSGIECIEGGDLVNNPPHYKSDPSGIECIEISENWSFCLGNALKYLWRNGKKDGEPSIKDLEKAKWYIEREIDRQKRINNKQW